MLGFYFYVVLALLAGGGAYWLWKRHIDGQLAEAGQAEWDDFQARDPEFIAHLDREQFQQVFHHTHFPRYPRYWLIAVSAFVLLLPIVLIALYAALWLAAQVGIVPQPVDFADQFFIDGEQMRVFTTAPPEAAVYYAENLGGFYYFFGVLGAWLAIVALTARHYHKNRPGYLRDEIIRAR